MTLAPQQSQPSRVATRRRQRSTRLTVAVGLLVLAAVLVGWAVVDNVLWLRSFAAVAAVLLGAAATRITHSELVATRRDAARDRARQAQDYLALTEQRVAEQARFARDMHARISGHQTTIGGLERALGQAQRHVAETTRKLNSEARRAEVAERVTADIERRLEESETRAAEAIVRLVELEAELDTVRAELTSWQTLSNGPARKHA